MKNLVLALTFVLMGSLSFAKVNLADKLHAITFTSSCGLSGSIWYDSSATTYDVLEMAAELEAYLCG